MTDLRRIVGAWLGVGLLGAYPGKATTVADGVLLAIPGKGISIAIPEGWHYRINEGGSSVFATHRSLVPDQDRYDPNLQIIRFAEPYPLDQQTAELMMEKIPERFSKASAAIKNYVIRGYEQSHLENGLPVILFYADFKMADLELMHLHVLTSSPEYAYLLTYADYRANIDGRAHPESFDQAWAAVQSVQLELGPVSSRQVWGTGLKVLVAALVLSALLIVWRRRRASKPFLVSGDDEALFDDDVDEAEQILADVIIEEDVAARDREP